MTKFRKKPVVIEAERFDGTNAILDWLGDTGPAPIWGNDASYKPSERAVFIRTREGVMRADEGDWIICGVKGEFYPCKPDIFAATYELASRDEAPREGPIVLPDLRRLGPDVAAFITTRQHAEDLLAASAPSTPVREAVNYDPEKEWSALLHGIVPGDVPQEPREQAMAFLRIWANSYLLNGNQWDIPQTMGRALNQVIRILEAASLAPVAGSFPQVDLPEDAAKVLRENLWKLYGDSSAPAPVDRPLDLETRLKQLAYCGLGHGVEGFPQMGSEWSWRCPKCSANVEMVDAAYRLGFAAKETEKQPEDDGRETP
jgi:hypothetical protein